MALEDKKIWVLLRGLVRECGHWLDFPSRFVETFPEARVLCLDLPGAGEFRHLTSPDRLEEITDFVRGQVHERVGSKKPVHILAISLGGMVALDWVQRYPKDIVSCVFMNSSVQTLSPFYERLRWQAYKDLAKILMTSRPRDRESLILNLVSNSEEARQKALPVWSRLATERAISFTNMYRQLKSAARFFPKLEPLHVPAIVFSSLGDRMVEPACSQAVAKQWNLPIIHHPWAGHDLSLDDPEWVLNSLKNWPGAGLRGVESHTLDQ